MQHFTKVSVLGAGSWGSALTTIVSQIATEVVLWGRDADYMSDMSRSRLNRKYLSNDCKFGNNVHITHDISNVVDSELVIVTTPVAAMHDVLLDALNQSIIKRVLWACKGFEVSTSRFPHQIFADLSQRYDHNISCGAILGPSFAIEVVKGLPTALSIASADKDFALSMAKWFSQVPHIRAYANHDLIGSELAAGIKNIVALATGIIYELQLGHNAVAALITRSVNEIGRIIIKIGGDVNTIYGLAGLGDLILTCTSGLSRNQQAGRLLARGYSVKGIIDMMDQVVEGLNSVLVIKQILQRYGDIETPIIDAVLDIVENGHNLGYDIRLVISGLIDRVVKFE